MAVNRLASIFQKILQFPSRALTGLFGELYLILRSKNAVRSLAAWRAADRAMFDFVDGDIRIDVKATGGRTRIHTFSYEQCNPPNGTTAVVASLQVEKVAAGASLRSIIDKIEMRVSSHTDLVLKLHETVAATLGTNLDDGLLKRFDMRLADSSLHFYSLRDVPAIRGVLPPGVSDVHFRSDLSALTPLSTGVLLKKDPALLNLLPQDYD